ncbi:MAG TPA: multiprotein-bridging factor 1 family protein [Acidobacteriota bacterium]|nr:multiprotein-bridging factor 1 family protein [Acidobacteriota bacterium]
MPQCELCGADGPVSPTTVEGVSMKVCSKCARFGTGGQAAPSSESRRFSSPTRSRSWAPREEEAAEFVLPNAGDLLKAERERRGLRQVDMSRMLNLKESILHQFESKSTVPTLDVVKKIQAGLSIKLIGKRKEASPAELMNEPRRTGPSSFTLGDMIAQKMKK